MASDQNVDVTDQGIVEHGWFTKGTRNDVIDGKTAPWMVVVPTTISADSGDVVRIKKSSGEIVFVRLATEYPYASKKTNEEKRRWTFQGVEEDGSLTPISQANAELDTRTDLAADGYPEWWSRKTDGSVRWPKDDDIWVNRVTGEYGAIVRKKSSKYKIGWYPFRRPVNSSAEIPQGPLDRSMLDTGRSHWSSSGGVMNSYEYVGSFEDLSVKN